MIKPVRIGETKIGDAYPCFIIAEAGVNHNGKIEIAHKLIDAASQANADAIKFQSFIAEDLVTGKAKKAAYQVKRTGKGGKQYEMLKALELSQKDHLEPKKHCDEIGIMYLCTPYEEKSAEFLKTLGIAAYKIASTDITNIPFLRFIAKKNVPVILSTGMSSLGEVEKGVNELKKYGLGGKIVILQCTTEYPLEMDQVNLRVMSTLEKAFGCPIGFSDHTTGIGASPWAVAAGACLIEKHFTLDRGMTGPDHMASIEPEELNELVRTIRSVEAALGDGIKKPMECEIGNKPRMQKSLVARRTISAGDEIRPTDLTCKRPGDGLPPDWFDRIVGKKAKKRIAEDEMIKMSSIDWDD